MRVPPTPAAGATPRCHQLLWACKNGSQLRTAGSHAACQIGTRWAGYRSCIYLNPVADSPFRQTRRNWHTLCCHLSIGEGTPARRGTGRRLPGASASVGGFLSTVARELLEGDNVMAFELWDPFREAVSLRDAMNSLLQESFVRPGSGQGQNCLRTAGGCFGE